MDFSECPILIELDLAWPTYGFVTWFVVLAAALAGGALRGLTGFGAALLMAPVLSLVLSGRETMCLVTLLNAIPMGKGVGSTSASPVDRDLIVPMTVAAFAGIPLGIALVGALPPRAFGLVVGAAVILSALALLSGKRIAGGRSPGVSAGVGVLSGILTGFGGVGGPPAILYLLGVEPDMHRARATFIVFFAWIYPFALGAIVLLGLMNWRDFMVGGISAPLFHCGGKLGTWLYRRIGGCHFRPFVLVLLIVAGVLAASPRASAASESELQSAQAGMARTGVPDSVRRALLQCANSAAVGGHSTNRIVMNTTLMGDSSDLLHRAKTGTAVA